MATTGFTAELERFGPRQPPGALPSLVESQAYCRRLATTHYENFPVVSWLVPRSLYQHFCNVYAYCRWADDLGDETGDRDRALELLAWWRGELAACYAGRATHPVFVALGETIARFAIPRAPFDDLISAFEQDQRVTQYDTFDQLLDYCRQSANPVGRLVLYLCDQAREPNFDWADSICTGLQLANFWQDVARDFDIGRVYLPREDRERFGYTPEALHERVTNPQFVALLEFEVQRARSLLRPWREPHAPELACLPLRLQAVVELFARGGEEILDRIAAIGYRVWDSRPVVTKLAVARLFAGCVGRAIRRRLQRSHPNPATPDDHPGPKHS
ncbi:MAG: squalene synthase HpnC [Planctomycetaceae bacterium]